MAVTSQGGPFLLKFLVIDTLTSSHSTSRGSEPEVMASSGKDEPQTVKAELLRF